MCDLNKPAKYKTLTVYKVCEKIRDKYYACFSGLEISTGIVAEKSFYPSDYEHLFMVYGGSDGLYNSHAVHRVTGFKSLAAAKILYSSGCFKDHYRKDYAILKLKIADDIIEGTGKNILHTDSLNDAVVYAGKRILTLTELAI